MSILGRIVTLIIFIMIPSFVMGDGDTITIDSMVGNRIDFDDIVVKKSRKERRIQRKMGYTERSIRKVYPVALEASRLLKITEDKLENIDDAKERRKYLKELEKELYRQYKPVLKEMTFSQGLILLKLIDRETGDSSYQLVKELRGSLSAIFWQGIAKIFTANLKVKYDPDDEDEIIEYFIKRIRKEQGLDE